VRRTGTSPSRWPQRSSQKRKRMITRAASILSERRTVRLAVGVLCSTTIEDANQQKPDGDEIENRAPPVKRPMVQ